MPVPRTASTWAIAAVMVLFLAVAVRSDPAPADILRSDAKGYYAYLHALFIGHDLGHEPDRWEYVQHTPTGTLNKYFAGQAVLLLPFFLGAHAYVQLAGLHPEAFGAPYTDAVRLAALVYAWLGLLALRALLHGLGIREGVIAAVVVALGFGTQLLQYTALQPGWTHVYSFCCFAAFLLLTQRLAHGARLRGLIAWGALLGLIVLIRPVNGLVLLGIPVVLGDRTRGFAQRLVERPGITALGALAGGGVVMLQPLLWKAQVGSFWAYGYQGEGFHWDRPAVLQVLFSVRRGLFVWTPVMIAAAISVPLLARWDRLRAAGAALYWAANVYVIACWWIWYYGSGFGHRAFIEHYVVFVLPLALVLDRATRPWRRAAYGFLALASALLLAQNVQFQHGLIHHDTMDRRTYAYSFLRFDEAHRDRLGGIDHCAPFHPNGLDTVIHEHWDCTAPVAHWSGHVEPSGDAAHGNVVACTPAEEFGATFALRTDELPKGRALHLIVGFDRYVAHVNDTRHMLGVATVERSDGTAAYYEPFPMEPLPPAHDGVWEPITYRIALPPLAEGQYIKFYLWDQQRRSAYRLDDLDMTVLAVRPY